MGVGQTGPGVLLRGLVYGPVSRGMETLTLPTKAPTQAVWPGGLVDKVAEVSFLALVC